MKKPVPGATDLGHEARDNTVEVRTLVVEGLATLADTLLASAAADKRKLKDKTLVSRE